MQTENGYSPSRGRSKSVDDAITTPDLKSVNLDEAIDENEGESASPEAETTSQRASAVNGGLVNGHHLCHNCGSAIKAQ